MPRTVTENSLLAALPQASLRRLLGVLEPVKLFHGEVLYGPGEAMRHVYFPRSCLVCLLALADGHHAVEAGLVGREGMVGLPVALGQMDSPLQALVQESGTALRMESAAFRAELADHPRMLPLLHHYTFALLGQIAQTAACNRFHVVEQRLARWLLMTQDRMRLERMHMTHEFLGHMLGVRRVGVTTAAQSLQSRCLIRYSRGDITVLDRPGLEQAACSCYAVIRALHPEDGPVPVL